MTFPLLRLWLPGFLLMLLAAPGALAQVIPSLPATAPGTAKPLLTPPDSAFVQFNNRIMFPLYSFGDQTAQDRADLANLRLAETLRGLTAEGRTDGTAPVTVGTRSGQTVLLLDGNPLLTITDADTDHAAQTAGPLAQAWADHLNRAFRQALRERQPAYLRWAFLQAALLFLLGFVLHGVAWLASRRFHHRLGIPVQALLWAILLLRILDLFSQTRPFLLLLFTDPLRPLTVCFLIGMPAAVLVRVWGITLRRLFPPIPEDFSSLDRTERTIQRRVTLARVAEVAGATVIWTVAIIIATARNGVNLSALLTSAGLIGVALGFVAQDALRDFVSSLYILADDRFGVGDTIQVGVYEGRVERLNLRATQIRDMAGRLITISNRNIVEVANLTARWAQVDFRIGVSYYDDLDRASALLLETASALADEWPERVLAPPELLGVDAFTDLSVTLRLTLRTPPGDQWAVARELRLRVKTAFDAVGISALNNLYAPPPAPMRMPKDATGGPPAQ